MSDFGCNDTVIQNTSDGDISRLSMFHIGELGNGHAFSIPGTPEAWLAGRFPGIKGWRMIRKFNDLIDKGILRVVSRPTAPCGFGFNSSSSAWKHTPN